MATVPSSPIGSTIPAFSISGTLPPFSGASPTVPAAGSPYGTTLVDIVGRFATNKPRVDILTGFLKHRQALLALGVSGLQWVNGSFVENIEATENRSPNDIDTVTFVWRPPALVNDDPGWVAMIQANADVFFPNQAKVAYRTDPYFVDVQIGPAALIQQTAYWYGLVSHKRVSSLWKGMLAIPLDGNQDDTAAAQLLSTK